MSPQRSPLAAGLVLLALAGPVAPTPAAAERPRECVVPPAAGDWRRAGPGAEQDLVRLEVFHRCMPNQRPPRAVINGHEWTVRAFARCQVRDCLWGRAAAQVAADGSLHVVYVTFAARRSLRIVPQGDLIQVDTRVDYHDARRANLTDSAVFVRGR